MSGGARTCPHGHGRMQQWIAHGHQSNADGIERRFCEGVWKCGRCFHQMSRPFDCVAGVQPGSTALMSPVDAVTYPDAHRFGVPIQACTDVPECHVWIRAPETSAVESGVEV